MYTCQLVARHESQEPKPLTAMQNIASGPALDTRIHNGLETQYIIRLWARYSHVMIFTGHGCVSNGHNAFLSYSPEVSLKTDTLFA